METARNTFTTGLNLATTGERPEFQVQGFTKWGQKLKQANSKSNVLPVSYIDDHYSKGKKGPEYRKNGFVR